MEKTVIGQGKLKPDAWEKVTGEARYAGDVKAEGQLYAKAVRSPFAHARVKGIDAAKALSLPGVKVVLTAADIPGQNRIGMTGAKDQRVFADDKVRFLGEAVAIVAATSETLAEQAAQMVGVTYEELEVVESPEQALQAGAPQIGDKGNLCVFKRVVRGDVEAGLREADVIVEEEYFLGPVEHAYIEPEAVFVKPKGDALLVWSATKSVHLDRTEIARVLNWKADRIQVVAPTIGGSFGGKSDLALVTMAALVAAATQRPVAMRYTREESFQVTTKRHGCTIRYTHGATKEGALTAVKMDLMADAGAYVDYTSVVLPRMAIFGAGPYRVPHVMLEVRGVHTNNPVSGAMRGFGQPQVAFACERQMDRLAEVLGMDPWEFRMKNALQEGDLSATGQKLHGVTMRPLLEKARELMAGAEPAKPPRSYEQEGWGMACFYFGNGRTSLPNPGVAHARVTGDGLVEFLVGSPDIGQGSDLLLAQIAAGTLGFPLDAVKVTTADTRCTPDSGTTSGTRLTVIVGKSVQFAADKLRTVIMEKARNLYRVGDGPLELAYDGKEITVKGADAVIPLRELFIKADGTLNASATYDPPVVPQDENGQGTPYAFYTYGVQCAKVRVNPYTGKVNVERMIAVYDAGTIINPVLFTAQLEGAVCMGIGYALCEEVQLSRGKVLNPNFDTYIMPTSMDMPPVDIAMLEVPDQEGPFGAKGIGEPAVVPTAAAIANAVARATGARFSCLPLSLEEVTEVLTRKEEEEIL
ncbi:MAG: putative xanthine dehydrogenase subunit D [Syntrophorhabdaceae bacterium PtaU1.Bin034]|nr:MAG: putative xanthine dehydrogenase subunit D [Syntrophorhabdaceae bacterium PtaU1.Bin034]